MTATNPFADVTPPSPISGLTSEERQIIADLLETRIDDGKATHSEKRLFSKLYPPTIGGDLVLTFGDIDNLTVKIEDISLDGHRAKVSFWLSYTEVELRTIGAED